MSASSEPGGLPFIPLRWRSPQHAPKITAWLLACWDVDFADGNRLCDLLISADGVGSVGPGDVDELLRHLRVDEPKPGSISGLGWITQVKWCAHLSAWGRSRAAFIGLQGIVRSTTDDQAWFHASCFGFKPNRDCAAYKEWVERTRGARTLNVPTPQTENLPLDARDAAAWQRS